MIIKAQELRIGNFLYVAGNIWTVSDIFSNPDELYFKENENYNHLLNAEGIPITDEWLLRFGFEQTYKSQFRTKYDYIDPVFGFDFDKDGITNGMQGFRYYDRYIDLKYIHQIQNLIHANTGKELELKK